MSVVTLEKVNEAYIRVNCNDGIARELWQHFSFKPKNFQHMQKFRKKQWTGEIRLFNMRTRMIYHGLAEEVIKFCKTQGYDVEIEFDMSENAVALAEVTEDISTVKIPDFIKARDYQIEAIAHCIRSNRGIVVSPTGSGKSLTLYLLSRLMNKRTLIIVPTIMLVTQMYNDFVDYASIDDEWKAPERCQMIMGGLTKEAKKDVVISTWQSLITLEPEYFEQFDMVIVDEVHTAAAKSIQSIMGWLENCKYRFGLTGTLQDSQCDELVLKGLFGPIKQVVSTKELIDRGILSDVEIHCLLLKYSKESRKALPRKDYNKEIEFLIAHEKRNNFIAHLALSLPKHTLIMYSRVEKHGQILYDLIRKKTDKVFFIHGGVSADERERIRQVVDKAEEKYIIISSYQTFQLGVNLPNLHNIIFASPSKGKIRVLQSLGRGLRKAKGKTIFQLFDIADDLALSKTDKNYTLNHLAERLKLYVAEQFKWKLKEIRLEND
jgi:hypothetical protein